MNSVPIDIGHPLPTRNNNPGVLVCSNRQSKNITIQKAIFKHAVQTTKNPRKGIFCIRRSQLFNFSDRELTNVVV